MSGDDGEGSLTNKAALDLPGEEVVKLNVSYYRAQLDMLLQRYQNSQLIDACDMQLLTLRFGLVDGYCHTLIETGNKLQMSSENVRRRQYVILRKKIRDPLFFHLLNQYHQYVRLPRGIQRSLLKQEHFIHKNNETF